VDQDDVNVVITAQGTVADGLFDRRDLDLDNMITALDVAAIRLLCGSGCEMDSDGDGLVDSQDNCTLIENPDQRDTDGDGYGNFCDADLDGNGFVNSLDLGLFKLVFFTADADGDLNGDNFVNSLDLGLFKQLFFQPPGPSGLVP
jgi:hypothetical protein